MNEALASIDSLLISFHFFSIRKSDFVHLFIQLLINIHLYHLYNIIQTVK